MAVKMPSGKRFAVCFTFDVDITSLWLGCFRFHTMNPLSRGEFGVRYGLPRILNVLDKYGIKGTFYLPGHSAVHHPKEMREIAERGHDIGSHGMYHQPSEVGLLGSDTSREKKRDYLRQQIAAIEKATGVHPVGFRSPIGDYGPDMPELLVEEGGFTYDSDSNADELPFFVSVLNKPFLVVPYTKVYNDTRYLIAPIYATPRHFFETLKSGLDVMLGEARRAGSGRMMSVGLHPRWSGQAARAAAIRDFIAYAKQQDGVRFMRRNDIADHWIKTFGR